MRSIHRGMALGVGLALGRMLHSILSLFLGLVTVCTIGMFLFGHWLPGSLLFLAAMWCIAGCCACGGRGVMEPTVLTSPHEVLCLHLFQRGRADCP